MPIYLVQCSVCGNREERICQVDKLPVCKCGGEFTRLPTYPVMVKIKGWGGYPSRRKLVKGTAACSA